MVVLGISPDNQKTLKQWQQRKKLPYDLLSDPKHKVLAAWGAWQKKLPFGNKHLGVTRSHWIIDENGVILDEQRNINPKNSVRVALDTITKG